MVFIEVFFYFLKYYTQKSCHTILHKTLLFCPRKLFFTFLGRTRISQNIGIFSSELKRLLKNSLKCNILPKIVIPLLPHVWPSPVIYDVI